MPRSPYDLVDAQLLLGDDKRSGGRSVTLTSNFGLQDLLNVVCDDALASVVTVSFHWRLAAGGDSTKQPRVYARIDWGVAGAAHTADIDVRQGTTVSLSASSLRVAVGLEVGSATNVDVSAFVSYLPRAGPSWVTRTRYLGTTEDSGPLLAGGTYNISVPTFATDVDVRRTPAGADYTLRFMTGQPGNPAGIAYEMLVGAGSDPGPVRLSNEVGNVRIVNGATAIPNLRAIFGLAL